MNFTDRALERRIAAQAAKLGFAMQCGGAEAATKELDVLKELIAQRSPEAVAEMERKRGLTHRS